MGDISAPLSGDLIDERLVPVPPPPPAGKKYLRRRVIINGQERDLPGSYLAKRDGNARALILVDATATPNYSTVLTEDAKRLAASEGLSEAEAQAALIELASTAQWYKDRNIPAGRVEYNYRAFQEGKELTWSGNVVSKTFSQMGTTAGDMSKGVAQGALVDTPTGIYYIFRHPIEAAKGLWNTVTHPLQSMDNAAQAMNESVEKGEGGFTLGRMWGNLIGAKGIGAATKVGTARLGSALGIGEPVSVANGEYLETWRDFLIPGTFAFDGSRYMGLKLELPTNYESPLGPCQISMFDEIFSNPERGRLIFHDREGNAIPFRRPFNFLPSVTSGYPNLELKAPWLKQLTLKDGRITKCFKQYPDKVYRLEKIEDLNGFELHLRRTPEGHLTQVDGPDGLKLSFENDADGLRLSIALIGVDDTVQQLARYSYDNKGRMIAADCHFGMSVRYIWQAESDLISFWHNLSRQSETHFTYDDESRVVHTTTNGIWNGDRFEYEDGETRYLPGGNAVAAQRFQYDKDENITAEINALGGVVTHEYDANGFRVSTMDANGHITRTKYDSHGNVSEQIDAEGRATTYVWGDDGELHLLIDGAGNRKTYEHDDRSNVIAETDAEGHTTRLSRDAKGRVVATEFPNGAIERRSWDEFNRLVSVTNAKGFTTAFAYDAFNRLIAITDPMGFVTRRDYQAGPGGFDTPSMVTRPDGVTVSRGFDAQGRLSSVADGEGRTWVYHNGAFGILQSITDPKGGVISFDYDSEGRMMAVTNALGCVYRYGRDAAGRVIEEEDFDGRLTRYRRDAAGYIVETIKPNGARLNYGYDKSGLLRRIENFDAKGEPEDVTRFWYDSRGLLVRTENKAALVEFERDRNGRIVGETSNGKRIKSIRDSMGQRILREVGGLGGGLVEYIRDPLGAIEKIAMGETEITFKRDALGRETRREVGGFGLAQRYNETGQLTAQAAGKKSPVDIGISRLGWHVPSGEGAPRRSGTVNRIYEYDRAFAPVRVDDGLWGEVRLDYDDNGQIVATEGARGTERFSYDAARNLAGASSSAPFSTESAGYGPAFDATFGTVTPSGRPSPWQRTSGGVVQIARGPRGEKIQLEHDDCGRLVERRVERDGFRPQYWRYRWDAQDRLIAVTREDGEEWLFRYDPFGRRISKVRRFPESERERAARIWPTHVDGDGAPNAAGQATSGGAMPAADSSLPVVGMAFLWDGAHMVAEAPLHLGGHITWDEAVQWHFEGGESDDDSASHRLLAKSLPAGSKLPTGAVLDTAGLFPVVCDQLGTPKEIFDTRGDLVWAADHHVWGEVRAVRTHGAHAAMSEHRNSPHILACPWRFPGQYEDAETGLFYNRYRYYDPLTGQFAVSDPLGLAGGDRLSSYVENPTVWVDPLGLEALTAGQRHYLFGGVGGRWGSAATRLQNFNIARGYEKKGYRIQGGGFGSEEYIPPPPSVAVKGSTKGGTYVDVTARKNGQTIRVQTVDTLADGVTPTPREAANAARIRAAFPNDQLILIPKVR